MLCGLFVGRFGRRAVITGTQLLFRACAGALMFLNFCGVEHSRVMIVTRAPLRQRPADMPLRGLAAESSAKCMLDLRHSAYVHCAMYLA